MKSNHIRDGDTVIVEAVDTGGEFFDLTGPAVVLRTPAGAGDLWHLELEDGTIWAMNPYCSGILGMRKINRDA